MQQELKKKYDFYQDEFDKETRNEMEEWARLVDKYAAELKKFDLVCAFCGQHLSDHSVNSECVENNSLFDCYTYFTDEEPPQHLIHKSKHWFGTPSMRQIQQQPVAGNHNRTNSYERSATKNNTADDSNVHRKLVQNLTA